MCKYIQLYMLLLLSNRFRHLREKEIRIVIVLGRGETNIVHKHPIERQLL